MPTWNMPPVSQEATVTLCRWQIYRISMGGEHWDFVRGWDVANACGRCSTPVIEFDPANRRMITRSGRVYVLKGPSGLDEDAAYVFHSRFGVVPPAGARFDDVSMEYTSSLGEGMGPV